MWWEKVLWTVGCAALAAAAELLVRELQKKHDRHEHHHDHDEDSKEE